MNKNFSLNEIKNILDKKVIGQESAKKLLTVAFYEQQEKINSIQNNKNYDYFLTYNHSSLLLGPEGCGKTLLFNELLNIFNIPCIKIDAKKSLTKYDLDYLFKKLYIESNENLKVAEYGILFIENIESVIEDNNSLLIDFLKQKNITFNYSKDVTINFNLNNLLIIAEGVFDEGRFISYPIKNDNYNLLDKKFRTKISFYSLEPEELSDILTKTNNSELQYFINEYAKHGIKLEFTDEAIQKLGYEAYYPNKNVYSLNDEILKLMCYLQFYLLGNKNITSCKINSKFIYNHSKDGIELK